VQARLLEFSAPQLGTLARLLAEALGSGADLRRAAGSHG